MKRFIFVTWMVMGGVLCARSMRAQGAVSFPYPEIPVSISEPQMRLSYLLNHFWDNFLFADTSQTNRKLAEQGIADYLNLLPHVADSASQCSAVDVFVRQAFEKGAKGLLVRADRAAEFTGPEKVCPVVATHYHDFA